VLEGEVVDEASRPIPGAYLQLWYADAAPDGPLAVDARRDRGLVVATSRARHQEVCMKSRLLDQASGELVTGGNVTRRGADGSRAVLGSFGGQEGVQGIGPNQGGASRFFYTSKVRPEERNLGGIDCKHPTLKPIDLCEYLARLVLPPARKDAVRRLLVPFAGAGSEMIGALEAGWEDVLGIELEEQSAEWARARIAAFLSPNPAERNGERDEAGAVLQPSLFE
jgi:hypothetical protein